MRALARRDEYVLRSLVGLGTYQVNEVFKQLFFIMGIWPLIYTALLIPAGKSGNNVPAWPFVTLSYAFGRLGWWVWRVCGGEATNGRGGQQDFRLHTAGCAVCEAVLHSGAAVE